MEPNEEFATMTDEEWKEKEEFLDKAIERMEEKDLLGVSKEDLGLPWTERDYLAYVIPQMGDPVPFGVLLKSYRAPLTIDDVNSWAAYTSGPNQAFFAKITGIERRLEKNSEEISCAILKIDQDCEEFITIPLEKEHPHIRKFKGGLLEEAPQACGLLDFIFPSLYP